MDSVQATSRKDFLINMFWCLAIIIGALSVPFTMVLVGRMSTVSEVRAQNELPGEVSFTIEKKEWDSMAGMHCIDPEHIVNCYSPKYLPGKK